MKTKKIFNGFISSLIVLILIALIFLPNKNKIQVNAVFENSIKNKSCVLIEKSTGTILFDNQSNEHFPIASVTKLMTVLLTLENLESGKINLNDKILVSENASGMGGSQIFLDANCEYEIGNLLKSVIVCSANDSSVALAEHIAGSEKNFVKLMNEKVAELGLTNTNYSNCTGLPTADGYSSAYDQAIILKQVLSYDLYHEYSSIWLEDFCHPSGRITQMTNTNKLSRYYDGCIGGKTGSTNQAKYCLAVGAKRNNTELIAVVLGAETSQERFKLASDLLNYGFSNFESTTIFSSKDLENITLSIKGSNEVVNLKAEKDYSVISKIGENVNFSLNYHLPQSLTEVKENQVVGNVEIVVNGIVVDTINILSCSTIDETTVWEYFKSLIA